VLQGVPEGVLQGVLHYNGEGVLERKGKEGKGKEGKEKEEPAGAGVESHPASDSSSSKPIKPPKAKPAPVEIPPLLSLSPEFVAAWARWVTHRRELRKPLTPTATQQQFAELERMGPDDAAAAIDQSIRNGWTGIFAPKAPRPAPANFAHAKPTRETVWQITQRLEAVESSIREIEGRSPGPHCQLADFLRPGEGEKLIELRKTRKALREQLANAEPGQERRPA
jgi:hypothetical protein